MKKIAVIILSLLVLTAGVFASGTSETGAQKTVILKGGLVNPADTMQAKCLFDWAERVKVATEGRVIIEVYPAEQLGNEKQLLENLNLGTIDFAEIGPGGAERFTPVFGMFENAYSFQSVDHIKNSVMNIEFIDYLNEILEAKSNISLLGFQWFGSRHVIADKPILTPEDGNGMLIRTPDVASYQVAMRALGATATPLAYGEVYMALSQGVIDAAECPYGNINVMKWYEVKKHITTTSHVEGVTCVFMSKSALNKLSAEDQKIVRECALEAWNKEFEDFKVEEGKLRAELESKGVIVHDLTPEQKQVFIDRAQKELAETSIPVWGEAWTKFQSYAK